MKIAEVIFINLAGVAILMGIIVLFAKLFPEKSQEKLDQWVMDNGWSRLPDDPSFHENWPGQPFNIRKYTEGFSSNIVTGKVDGMQALCWLFTIKGEPDGLSDNDYFQLTAVRLPREFAPLEMVRGGPKARALALEHGRVPITYGSAEFQAHWYVLSQHPRDAKQIVTEDLQRLLLDRSFRPSPWRLHGEYIISWSYANYSLDRKKILTDAADLVLIARTITGS